MQAERIATRPRPRRTEGTVQKVVFCFWCWFLGCLSIFQLYFFEGSAAGPERDARPDTIAQPPSDESRRGARKDTRARFFIVSLRSALPCPTEQREGQRRGGNTPHGYWRSERKRSGATQRGSKV